MKKPVYAESYCEETSMKLEKSRWGAETEVQLTNSW